MTTLRVRLEGAAWLTAWQISRLLPERFVVRAFERLAERSYRRNERRRRIVEQNLAAVVPPDELAETVRAAFRWYGRYWAETFRMHDISEPEFARRFSIEGDEHIERAVAAGRGAVFATLHQGNWDAGGRWAARRWGLTVVVEVLRPRSLFERFVAHRRELGMRIIPLERGGDATARCIDELRQGRLVALVADRDLTGRGVEVEMFGRRTRLPRGPALLSIRTGAPLIPATILQRDDGSWHAHVMPPLDSSGGEDAVPAITQRLARAYEDLIARAPAQWHMFSSYWLDPS